MARPIKWTEDKKKEVINQILLEITEGKSLRQILDDNEDLPARKTFYEWLAKDNDLSNHYARMSEVRSDIIFDEMIEIADDGTNDYMETEMGLKLNAEHIQRSRLRIDTRKWILSKMNPKKYGDKIHQDHTTNGEKITDHSVIISFK